MVKTRIKNSRKVNDKKMYIKNSLEPLYKYSSLSSLFESTLFKSKDSTVIRPVTGFLIAPTRVLPLTIAPQIYKTMHHL